MSRPMTILNNWFHGEGLPFEKRLSRLETKVNFLVTFAVLLIGVAGTAYWELFHISEKIGSLVSRVDGIQREDNMRVLSAVSGSAEVRQEFERIVAQTLAKQKQGERVPSGLYYEFGIYSATNGNHEPAIEYFKQAVAEDPLNYRAFSSMGAAYISLGQTQAEREKQTYYATKAIDALNRAIGLNPNHATAHSNLGIAYAMTDQPDAASREWSTALKLDPTLDFVYYNLACQYANQKDTEKALDSLEAAVNRYYRNLPELEEDEDRCFKYLTHNKKFQDLKDKIRKLSAGIVVQ